MDGAVTDRKQALYALCLEYVNQRVSTAQNAMNAAQESANSESKSSAGDKYETGRAMMQLERDRHAALLNEALKLKKELELIDIRKTTATAQPGSLIVTDQGTYFLSISAGKLSLEGREYLAISLASPIGSRLFNRKVGDEVVFNSRTYRILAVD